MFIEICLAYLTNSRNDERQSKFHKRNVQNINFFILMLIFLISAFRFKIWYYITFDHATFYPCLIPERSDQHAPVSHVYKRPACLYLVILYVLRLKLLRVDIVI